ncbi:MAG: hypothetical protein KDK75_06270, partial [Alphaproteobacteria bacterium]|nr:hypothetical protein [Alphaproteobacteria bacterium]
CRSRATKRNDTRHQRGTETCLREQFSKHYVLHFDVTQTVTAICHTLAQTALTDVNPNNGKKKKGRPCERPLP